MSCSENILLNLHRLNLSVMFQNKVVMLISFLYKFLFMCYKTENTSNGESLTPSFSIYLPLFSFSCLIYLTRASSTILNRYGEWKALSCS